MPGGGSLPVWSLTDTEFRPRFKRRQKAKQKCKGYKVNIADAADSSLFIGMVWIGTTNNTMPSTVGKCKASFIHQTDADDPLLSLSFEECDVIVRVTTDVEFLEGILSSKVFALLFDQNESRIFAKIYFTRLPVEASTSKVANTIKTLFAVTFDIRKVETEKGNKLKKCAMTEKDIDDFFGSVKEFQKGSLEKEEKLSLCDGLRPTLRPYQEEAVRWMIKREQVNSDATETLHPMFEKVTLGGGTTVYFNKYTGHIESTPPLIEPLRTGGILADEMGLGKTVEVLACILSNPKSQSDAMDVDDKKVLPCITMEVEDKNDSDSRPVVEHQPKRRRFEKPTVVVEIEEEKPRKRKRGVDRKALQKWYEVMLMETSVSKRERVRQVETVQCICGNVDAKGIVRCTFCNKQQHANCLGYNKSLGVYICPQCWMEQPLLETRATLIVCPTTLRKQWLDEICKHVAANIKILNYQGSAVTPVYPTHLQTYDLVLTTYSVLQADLRLSETGQEFNLRHQRKYCVPGSSITRLKWWRLCFDEAQTFETARMVSEMAQKLTAVHRWAVTGTPISKDITDLYALIDTMQLKPYADFDCWEHLLLNPYLSGNTKPLYEFMSQILWRSSKEAVIEQIQIPKQTVMEHFVNFSAVEKYFYKREHTMCTTEFMNCLRSFDLNTPLKNLNKSEMKKILSPLLTLRQACVHPGISKGRYLARKQVTSMEELLDALIAKNITESNESLRLIVSSLNGLAGIYLLLQKPSAAVEQYRKVMQLADRYNKEKEEVAVDTLQLIHTMHNLAEVLATAPAASHTLRDDSLREDCRKQEEKYIQKYITQSKTALEEINTISESSSELQNKFTLTPGEWYIQLINYISQNSLTTEFFKRIAYQHETCNVDSIVKSCTERKIVYLVSKWDNEISELGTATLESINRLYTKADNGDLIISKKIVETAMDCHLRPPQKKGKAAPASSKQCLVCAANDNLNLYECRLFSSVKKDKEGTSNTCAWKPSSEELILKALYTLGKSRSMSTELISDGKTHLKLIELLKKEFKEVRKFWTCLDQQIRAQDELDMCKIRLQLKSPNIEEKTKKSKAEAILKQLSDIQNSPLEDINLLSEHELDYHRAVLQSEEKSAAATLEKSLGVSSYLKTVKQQQYLGQSADPCPICKTTLQDHWGILPCGHCYCLDCLGSLLANDLSVYINCPVCRQREKVSEIAYIKPSENKKPDENVQIKGNYSSKIEAIVTLICKLKTEDPDVKVLLFSTWHNILKVFETALEKNAVSTAFLTQITIDKTIQKFKDGSKKITALLLPISLGSKGLNLIEATHVIFSEPLLNPGDELQAVGRVHRIGQTKPTVVHKFVVRDTIEENVYKAISSDANNWDKNKITLKLLKDLFVSSTSNEQECQEETG